MISELREKIKGLNEVVDKYQKGNYSEREFKEALNEQMEEAFIKKDSEESICGNPHNNGDESCMECEIVKYNI